MYVCISYMRGEVISVLSLERRYQTDITESRI